MRPRSRMRGTPGAGGGSAEATTSPSLSFSIPLKDTSKPVAFPPRFRKHIALEFATRYLCEIGATPTVENCRAVLKEMPLENCSITAAWRSRGCLTDAIIIQPGGHRSGGGVGAAGGMGEAPPAPSAGKIQPSTTSSAKDGGPTASEPTGPTAVKDGGRGRMNGGHTRVRTNRKPATIRPTPSMGRTNPHKVSVFVDAVSSAIGPAVVETVRGAKKTQVSGAVAAAADLPHSTGGATTARERNNIRRRNGDLVVENISTTSRDPRPLGSEKQRAHGGWQSFRGPRHGGSMNAPAHHTGTSGDDSGGTDEALLWDAVEFAEARRKMLDPPKVDLAGIATIQTAFARNFPFQKHGDKFADLTVRSSLKSLITSEGPGRLIGLLSHYLFWVMLLPFALAHKDWDDSLLLQAGDRLSLRRQRQQHKDRSKPAENSASRVNAAASRATPGPTGSPSSPAATARTCDRREHGEDGRENGGDNGGPEDEGRRDPSSFPTGVASGTVAAPGFPEPPHGAAEQLSTPVRRRLTREEAESLFVAVVEAWSSLRSSLGASRRARLVQLPIAVAAVRHGVQTVLCNCYPFLERKGGQDGKRLLALLHEEVTTRFIPRFYYEGPFTPVAEEEKEVAPAVPAQTLRRQTSGRFGAASHPPATSSSSPPPFKEKKKDFLETSTTLLEARQRAPAGSGCGSAASTAAVDPDDDGLVDEDLHVVLGGETDKTARERPGGTRRTGEALFATSTTLGYVFPNPCSPEARKMIANRARARSSRDASRTTTAPGVGGGSGGGGGGGFGFAKTPPRSACGRAGSSTTSPPPSRAASTPGARGRPLLWTAAAGRLGGNAAGKTLPSVQAAISGSFGLVGPDTTSSVDAGGAGPEGHRDPSPQYQPQGVSTPGGMPPFPSRGATATGATRTRQTVQFHDQASGVKSEASKRPLTTQAHPPTPALGRGRDRGCGGGVEMMNSGNVGVNVRVGVGGVGVGAAAKARLYRGFCEQRGGDYDRQYRLHGGKQTRERIALLNDTFR